MAAVEDDHWHWQHINVQTHSAHLTYCDFAAACRKHEDVQCLMAATHAFRCSYGSVDATGFGIGSAPTSASQRGELNNSATIT